MAETIPGWKPGDPIRVLPWGASKVGKTFGAGSFPRPNYLDFDRGIGTVFSPDFFKIYGYRKIQHREFYERSFIGPIVNAHNAYDDACRYFDECMKPGKVNTFDTWVVDSGTTLSADAQNKAVILLGTDAFHHMSNTQKEALQYQLLVPKIQDYGAERSLVEQFVDMVLSTTKNVVFICHEYEQKDKQGTLIGLQPLLTGQSRQAVPLRFDEVYWIRAKREGKDWKRVCMTQPDGIHTVGSRSAVPNDILWDYEAILKALTNSYDERIKQISAAQTAADKAAVPKVASTPAALKAS